MAQVILAYTNHGVIPYASATALLKSRIKDGYWYEDEDLEEAQKALSYGNDASAWKFLSSRSDYEYEGVQIAWVQDE